MRFETSRRPIATFTTISLTDIVLLLLIFFLLSSSFILQPGIRVRLPKASSTEAEPTSRVYLTITAREEIYLNEERVSKGELGAKLRTLLAKLPQKLVIVKADKDLTLERAIEVIDIAKLAGADKFLIATQPSR